MIPAPCQVDPKVPLVKSKLLVIVLCLLVVVGFGCLLLLWPDTHRSLEAGRVFDGARLWLTLGIVLLFYRDIKAWSLRRRSKGWEKALRSLMVLLISTNIIENLRALWPLWVAPLLKGDLHLPWQDWALIVACSVTLIVIGVWAKKTGRKLFDPLPVFFYVISTRVVPQIMLAILPLILGHAPFIPRATVWGLFAIALQQLAMSWLEYIRTQRKLAQMPSLDEVAIKELDASKWLFRSDVANTAAAVFVLALCMWQWA